jgi:hypothetical protein
MAAVNRLQDWSILLILFLNLAAGAQSTVLNPHGVLKWKCESCHTPDSFFKINPSGDFNHRETGFLLIGKHQAAPCAGCHTELILSRVATACADCHTDVHRGQFGFACQNCHTPERWENQQNIFDLHATRGFSLVGVHATVDCQACHIDEQRYEFTMTPADCASCHLGDYLATENPNHVQAGFGLDCQSCHLLLAVQWGFLDVLNNKTMNIRGIPLPLECEDCH